MWAIGEVLFGDAVAGTSMLRNTIVEENYVKGRVCAKQSQILQCGPSST